MNRLFPLATLLLGLGPISALSDVARADAQRLVTLDAVQTNAVAVTPQLKAADRRLMVVEQADDGLFYVMAVVNGASVKFVVDTGSSVTVLNAADAARAGVGAAGHVAVETAGGSAPMQRARIARVDFAGRTLTGIDAAIVKNDLAVSLLGQSALSQLDSVTFRGRRLELQ